MPSIASDRRRSICSAPRSTGSTRSWPKPVLADRFGITASAPVFVAHELYHHVELTRAAPRLGRQHAVSVLRLGPPRQIDT